MRRDFGFSRGTPVDRIYIEKFLAAEAANIRGRVLEFEDADYTKRFGASRVTASDVLHRLPGNPQATIVADLSDAPQIPDERFDCVILTQVLQYVPEPTDAIRTLYRILKPGGTVLATLPFIAQMSKPDRDSWGEYWRFSSQAAARLFGAVFGRDNIEVHAYGNSLCAVAMLQGLAAEDLRPEELAFNDPDYEFLITVAAHKKAA